MEDLMKTVKTAAFQGDVMLRRVPSLPETAKEVPRSGPLVIAHSETGHHHAIDSKAISHFEIPGDPLVCYLRMDDGLGEIGGVDVVHHRSFDTHETLRLLGKPGDIWEVRRQREWSPEGWRRVVD
jgi:hypothetical protein